MRIEVKITLPKDRFERRRWIDAIANKQRSVSMPKLRNLFKQTVFGWAQKPDFGWSVKKSSSEVALHVYPSGSYSDIWNLVNQGSPPHRIPRSGFTRMSFRTGYRAATRPGSLQSGRKYRSGPYRTAYVIEKHPGFEGRKFTELIRDEFDKTFRDDMQQAINEVAKRKF